VVTFNVVSDCNSRRQYRFLENEVVFVSREATAFAIRGHVHNATSIVTNQTFHITFMSDVRRDAVTAAAFASSPSSLST